MLSRFRFAAGPHLLQRFFPLLLLCVLRSNINAHERAGLRTMSVALASGLLFLPPPVLLAVFIPFCTWCRVCTMQTVWPWLLMRATWSSVRLTASACSSFG
jgi:hypothetical protein